ncbi:glycosyltransferase family 39 protein [Streptomyces sp. NRRL B-24484]|uniref:glycosyltransferase family 39 protein n=1 Tax=Streptomyces sp. NRRL B-24484 TaxID=1463833 RepID=UPI0006947E6D|nr:glycosyltransferase family 39 protein [Streptomyces sp. NRRL B-24484]
MTASVADRDRHADPANAGSAAGRPTGGARDLLTRTVWLWPALLTLALGVRGSARPQLWRDELATWSAATRSTGEIFDMLQHVDAVSGAYYLLMHYWIAAFGDGPAVFRLPSALALAGTAAFTTLTARRLFDTRTALFAGVLFATVPSVSRFAQEARAYGFVLLAVSAATWLLLRALERPTVLRWLPYAVSVAAAGLFHMVSLMFLSGHLVVVFLHWRRSRDRRLLLRWPAAVLVGLVPLVPLVLAGRRQVGRQISWLHEPSLQTFHDYWHNLFGSPLVSMFFLLLVAIPAGWSARRRPAFETGVLAALPILLSWAASHGSSVYFFERYQLYTLPAWCVLAAAGLGSLRPRLLGVLGLAVAVVLGVPDQQKLRTGTSHEWTDGKRAAAVIADGYRPGDGFAPVRGKDEWRMLDFEIAYYLPGSVHLTDVLVSRTAVERDDLFASECTRPADCLGTNRVWVVVPTDGPDLLGHFSGPQADALRASYTTTQVQYVRGLTVALLERKAR